MGGLASAGLQEELGARRGLREIEEMGTRLNGEGLTEPPAASSQISSARRVKGPFYICSFSKHLLGAYRVLSPVRGALRKGPNWTDVAHILRRQMSIRQL